MRTLYLLSLIYIALFLSSCATNSATEHPIPKPCTSCQQQKDPLNVSFLTSPTTPRSYHVLGKATISQYNKVGIKRQDATIHELMSQLAAAQGGDALIDVKRQGKDVTGTIIAYQQVLV